MSLFCYLFKNLQTEIMFLWQDLTDAPDVSEKSEMNQSKQSTTKTIFFCSGIQVNNSNLDS